MTTFTYQERFRTLSGVFDEFTNRTLFQLQSRGIFEELISPLSVGKESNVFVASKKVGSSKKSNNEIKVIVKIYRMQNCDFKRMFEYIRRDPRYEFLKKHRRQIIIAWAQREYKNIIRAHRNKVRVPEPLGWRNHIIVEEFIGDKEAAPALKDQYPKNPRKFFVEVKNQMKKLYKAKLIHGDLSSFNILNYKEKPVLIDFSQSTLIRTPNSNELMERDVKNIVKFFNKFDVDLDEAEIYKELTQK